MKVLYDLPDELVELWKANPTIGRVAIQEGFGCGEKAARFYARLMKSGKIVETDYVKNKPEPGHTKKAGLLSDVHAPYQDQKALDAAVNYLLKIGVDMVVFTGDGVDNYKISKWNKNPLTPTFFKEVDSARCIIQNVVDAFPSGTEFIWLEGNHEIRLRSYIWSSAPELAGFECLSVDSLFGLQKMGFQYVSNVQIIQNGLIPFHLGNCFVLHGHEVALSGGAVNFAKLHYDKQPVNQVFGHHHQEQKHTMRKMNKKIDGSWALGCLCNLFPDYRPMNPWSHGCGIIELDCEDMFAVTAKTIDNGRIL